MKIKLLLTSIILIIAIGANAQSPIKPIPKPAMTYALTAPVLDSSGNIIPPPSNPNVLNAWRFTANIAGYGYTFNGVSSALAGAEYGFNHLIFNTSTNKYVSQWSANFAWFPLNSTEPITSIKNLESIAATFGYDNNLVQIGPLFNPNAPKGQKFGILVSIGITLNN